MAAKTAGLLGHGLTKASVSANLSVSAQTESNIVNVAATATSPALAAGIANTYTEIFVGEQQNHFHSYYASELRHIEKRLAKLSAKEKLSTTALALQSRAESVGQLAEQRNGNVEVAQSAAAPTAPFLAEGLQEHDPWCCAGPAARFGDRLPA
jgi:uncharacterized protein involved in exopolysaccharide biosynthesis